MASGEVCRALPTTVWSISWGSMPVFANRARAACAPRSIAETSAKEPLYSAIGVRTPSTRTRSRLFRSRLISGLPPSRRRGSMEAAAPAVDVHEGIDPRAEEHEDPALLQVDPEAVACETGETECGRGERPPRAAAERSPPPAQGEPASFRESRGHPLRLQQTSRRQPFRAEPPEIAGAAEQAGVAAGLANLIQKTGVAVLGAPQRRRSQVRNGEALLGREPHLHAGAHAGFGQVRPLPGRPLHSVHPQRIENALAEEIHQRHAQAALRRAAVEDEPEIAVGARPGPHEIAVPSPSYDQLRRLVQIPAAVVE